MKYLGITSNGHDASVAVVEDGNILFAAHQERFSGIKNDGDISIDILNEAKKYGYDQVCYYENSTLKGLRRIVNGQFSLGFNTFADVYKLKKMGLDNIKSTTHHRSHAAGGYYTSPFNDAITVVCDAIGEFQTLTVWHCVDDEMSLIHEQVYPHSVGLFYSAMTQRVGKKPNEEEYIMMGMAALGDPTRLKGEMLAEFVKVLYNAEVPIFECKHNLHKGCKWWRPDLTTDQDMYDIAAAAQEIVEDFMVDLVESFSHLSGNLVLSGGVALNCKANTEIAKRGGFEEIWIMPNPGDAGSSIGAIAAITKERINWRSAYLGRDIGRNTDFDGALKALLNGDVIGLAAGRSEWGPRALGNRSILVDPRGPETKDKVNQFKRREPFRPFAPVILEEFADQYFDMPVKKSPYMQFTAKCKYPDLFPAICHYDGTSRVQTVSKDDNYELHALITRFYEETGCPMLLNTSMNIKGKPLVDTVEQAIEFEAETGIKVF